MRAKHWIAVVLFVAVVASTQAYALTMDKEPAVAPQAAEVEGLQSASRADPVVSPAGVEPVEESADRQIDLPEPPAAKAPVDVGTLIVGFKSQLGDTLMEAIVRAAGAKPVSTVSAPGTVVVSVDKADRAATIAQLEANPLVANVAAPTAFQRAIR
jgi:hypothetical protein